MPSTIQVDQITGASGNTVTIPAGQTLDLSGATITLPANTVTTTGNQTLTNKTINIQNNTVTGTLPVAQGGTGLTTLGGANTLLKVNSAGTALEYGTTTNTEPSVVTKLGEMYMGGTTFSTLDLVNDASNCFWNPKYKHIKIVFTDFTPQTNNTGWYFRIRQRNYAFETEGYYYGIQNYSHWDTSYYEKTTQGTSYWYPQSNYGEYFHKYSKMDLANGWAYGASGSWDSNAGNDGNTSARWGNITELTFPYWRSSYPSDNFYKTATGALGTINGTTLTITQSPTNAGGGFYPYQYIYGAGISTGTYIVSQNSGSTGLAGTYTINISHTITTPQTINGGSATEVEPLRDDRFKSLFARGVYQRYSSQTQAPVRWEFYGFMNRTEQNQSDRFRSVITGLRAYNSSGGQYFVANNNPNCKIEWYGFNDILVGNSL